MAIDAYVSNPEAHSAYAADDHADAEAVHYAFLKGDKGDKGDTGPAGPQGARGEKGEKGDPGAAGETGPAGPTGPPGPKGDTGETGPQGERGPAGETGPRGPQGERGETGETGPVGPQGPAGPAGPAGTTDYNDLQNKPDIPAEAEDVHALPDSTKYARSRSVGGPAELTVAIPYGEVDNTSTSTAFTATVAGITELKDGTVVMLRNGVVTSASGFTININGLGAKPVYSNMATGNGVTPTNPSRETTIFNINYTLLLVYSTDVVDGGAWINYRGYNSDNNTIGYQLRTNAYNLPVSGACYRYRLLFTSADGKKFVPANTSSSTNATASRTTNTTPIDPFGPIVYYSSSAALASGGKPSAAALWRQYTIVFGYSFNNTGAALTMTYPAPVYLRCTPQADGSAVMDYFVQALPNTEDGKIYILLGYAYDATHIELIVDHPVYYYKDGAIRLWTGKAASGGGMLCTITVAYNANYDNVYTTDKTAQEIYDALEAGINPVFRFHDTRGGSNDYTYVSINNLSGLYLRMGAYQTQPLVAASMNDYFTLIVSGGGN